MNRFAGAAPQLEEQVVPRAHRIAIGANDDIAGPQPGARARLAGIDEPDARRSEGKNSPAHQPDAGRGVAWHVHRDQLRAARDLDPGLGPALEQTGLEVVPRLLGVVVHPDVAIAARQARWTL